jgi:hypothetical protein
MNVGVEFVDFFIITTGCDYVFVELRPLTGPFPMPQMMHELIWSSGGMILTGENRRTRRETFPSATSSTTNPTWTTLGSNPGLSGEKPATNRLRYGPATLSRLAVSFKSNRRGVLCLV